ncbi:FAD-dependent oxidoreductase [Acidocella facilis]|uniref:FAD-dependent oxidoreductase n=1 Tax=Acidocella facilis TaxID=525 RepID=UPI001F16D9D8|nr:FAD-dependent oxidoreductase [Acidocella facilis]
MKDIVIIGAGTAGANAAAALRMAGFSGKIVLVGQEAALPYQRPPLSKAWLTAPEQPEPTLIHPASFYAEREIELTLARKAVGIDREECQVRFSDGGGMRYDALILATGASPRRLDLPGDTLRGIHYLRDLGDAVDLRRALYHPDCRAVAIIGAGVIGLEVASAAIDAGKAVTVIEAAARPMARVMSPATTNFITGRLRQSGITFLFNRKVESFDACDDRVTAVSLRDGARIPSDLVLVGIGAAPNDELAREARLDCANGICVDQNMRSSDPKIFAIGDCAYGENRFARGRIRIETIHNAVTQAQTIAAVLCDRPPPAPVPPRFWSDLKGMKLQVLGIANGYDSVRCNRSNAPETLEVRLMEGNRLSAVETVNLPASQSLISKAVAPRA